MTYLEEFKAQINNRDFSKFLQLWEEYSASDTVEAEEFIQLLNAIKVSDFAKLFGQFVETALPLWQTVKDETDSYHILRLLIDLQTTNSPQLAETALQALQKKYGGHARFNEWMRLTGLRAKENFQGVLSSFDLLAHMDKGKFVFHTGGWGTGEITDISHVREQMAVEFENVAGLKHITFTNAFKTLIPLPDENFLVRRFANPDLLESEARQDPVQLIKILLRDLGPKSAVEIKDELCELVIPEKDWSKWWQGARAKIKKDTMIESPESLKEPFRLRKSEETHEDRLYKTIERKNTPDEILLTSYSFVRDFPHVLKNQEARESIKNKLLWILSNPLVSEAKELQVLIFLETFFSHEMEGKKLSDYISNLKHIEDVLNEMEIIAFKKRALTLIREHRPDYVELFISLLHSVPQVNLRDYLLKELNQGETRPLLIESLQKLIRHPSSQPELFVWYFQKIITKGNEDLPFSDKEGQCTFFESFLILFSNIESKPEWRDLVKKMYNLLSGKRYAVVRALIEGTSLEFIKEFLLLVSKCQTLSDHDIKILRSLAEVVHPSLNSNKSRKHSHLDGNIIWTTEEGYLKTQERAKHIGTVEVVDNAREIEAARALGDLRENSEYKFALERRSRLQGELRSLSDQLKRARIITKNEISLTEVTLGSIVDIIDSNQKKQTYTILGPWEANPEEHVVSFQSKFAQAMLGLKEGDTFQFRDDEFKIVGLKNYFDDKK